MLVRADDFSACVQMCINDSFSNIASWRDTEIKFEFKQRKLDQRNGEPKCSACYLWKMLQGHVTGKMTAQLVIIWSSMKRANAFISSGTLQAGIISESQGTFSYICP